MYFLTKESSILWEKNIRDFLEKEIWLNNTYIFKITNNYFPERSYQSLAYIEELLQYTH